MNEHLSQLEALSIHPSLKVNLDQHVTIVESIVHHLMHPYFLQKSPETQEKFKDQYLAHLREIVGYCLREYVESPEPRFTIDFIKGLHRNLYLGLARVSVKTPDGSEIFMVPGEFKTLPNGISRRGKPNEFLATTSPEYVARDMEMLLRLLHDESVPLFQRYFRFMLDLTEIHPFPDGNGKLAALLGDLYLLKQGIHPLFFAKYKWENEEEFYELAERHSIDPQRDVSIFYPLAVRAYEGSGFIRQTTPLPDASNLSDQVFARLLEEIQSAIEVDPCRNLHYELFLYFWNQRHTAFSRWDEGIKTDWQGLHSVKPEVLALQLAANLPGKVVLDGFCGIGGCAIAFARSGKKVLAVELDERRLEMARNNARVYGVEGRITFIHGDVTELIGSLLYDAAFFDPPWGGPDNRQKSVFGWDDFPLNPKTLIHAALTRCETVALSVPFNFNVPDLRMDEYQLAVQRAEVGRQMWYLNAFYRK